MADPAPGIDFANLPAPDEGILVTLFITVRKVARSRDFYSRVLGGAVVLDENPCIVKLSNSWIIMNPGGPPTPDKPDISVVDYQPGNTTSIFMNLRVAADRPGSGDPLLYPGPGRLSHRGWPVNWPLERPPRREAPRRPSGLST